MTKTFYWTVNCLPRQDIFEPLPFITLLRFSSCSVHCVKLVLMVSQDVLTALRDTRETFVEGEK